MKKIRLYVNCFAIFLIVAGCSDSVEKASEKLAKMDVEREENKPKIKDLLVNAKNAKKIVFMIVESKERSGYKSKNIIDEVMKDIASSVFISMNVDDSNNAELIKEYGLTNAPIPLVLVFANNGLIVGGIPEDNLTKESLLQSTPTPKYGELINSINQKKPVFAVISNKDFKSNLKTLELCNEAKASMGNKADVIFVDFKDKAESNLIKMFNIKNELTDSFVITINGQGIMSGRFDALPSKNELVESANKVIQTGGCAPGGCTSTCD